MHRILLLLLLGLAVTLGADRSAQAYDDHPTTVDVEARAVGQPTVLSAAVFDLTGSGSVDVTTATDRDRAPECAFADAYLIDNDRRGIAAQLSIRIDVGGMQTNLALTFYDMDDNGHDDLFGADGIPI